MTTTFPYVQPGLDAVRHQPTVQVDCTAEGEVACADNDERRWKLCQNTQILSGISYGIAPRDVAHVSLSGRLSQIRPRGWKLAIAKQHAEGTRIPAHRWIGTGTKDASRGQSGKVVFLEPCQRLRRQQTVG